jgi:cytosine/uracil/thiamine/allantoin permease
MLRWLYDYAWFVGFFVAATAYVILMRGRVSKRFVQAG